MKLFVFEDVMCDWTCGMAVAIAKDVQKAVDLLKEKGASDLQCDSDHLTIIDLGWDVDLAQQCWYVHGGG